MFKSFQDTSALQQFHGFPNLNMQQATSAYGFSGVTFWLDAAYGLNTQTNLGAVSSWQQRVDGGTFVQATAGSQPRLILNDANYNNLPSVESVDTARSMTSTNGLRFNCPNTTIVVISKVNSFPTDRIAIICSTTISNFGIYGGGGGIVPSATGFGFYNNTPVLQGTTESTNPRIQILTGTNVIVNGVNEANGSVGTTSAELTRIFNTGGANALTGSIAEIIAFGYSMTSDEAIALSNKINQKYALY